MPCTKHCSLCGKAFKGGFKDVMAKLREHRKQKHPKAHRESVKKAMKTRSHDPIKKRSRMISTPQVRSFKDYTGKALTRILCRVDATLFPEFAVYVKFRGIAHATQDAMLKQAGLTEEENGKWVLRTNKFSIFVFP